MRTSHDNGWAGISETFLAPRSRENRFQLAACSYWTCFITGSLVTVDRNITVVFHGDRVLFVLIDLG